MRIVEENLKGKEGEIKLVPETLEDLWHLRFIIEKGDVVYSVTKRASQSDDKLRSDKEFFLIRVGIEVEKIEFQKFTNRLRVSGKIVAGEASGYHTLNLTIGKEFSIVKRWKDEQLKRLKKAVESQKLEILILTVEEGEAVAGILKPWGVESVFEVSKSYSKGFGGKREEFFAEIYEALKKVNYKYLVIAGPGFTKIDLYDFLKNKGLDAIPVDTSSIGVRGFVEVIKRRTIEKIVGELKLAEEAEYMEDLLRRISAGEKVAYGLEEVRKAKDFGAIEVLLISDDFLFSEREKWDIDSFLEEIEQNAKVVVMSSEFEPGEMLSKIGGIAAILRFNV